MFNVVSIDLGGGSLEPTCPHKASQHAQKSRLGALFGASWAFLGASWRRLGPSRRALGNVLGRLGGVLKGCLNDLLMECLKGCLHKYLKGCLMAWLKACSNIRLRECWKELLNNVWKDSIQIMSCKDYVTLYYFAIFLVQFNIMTFFGWNSSIINPLFIVIFFL